MNENKVNKGSKVALNFSLTMEDGQLVDSNFDKEPADLIIGEGTMPDGFEQQLIGLIVGQEIEVLVPCEKAFGESRDANIREFNRAQFAKGIGLEVGLMISFADKANSELPGVIVNIQDELVTVDFNHPLAGHNLMFKARVDKITQPMAE
ncbi:MAG: FKBP-type peptidyl-prolyl cis-trans isomerase [Pseudomonadales bacterium]|nr:FKBP-type peptidyl-prolyl cis-trans isomerase [Pseudomonadales bacterium]